MIERNEHILPERLATLAMSDFVATAARLNTNEREVAHLASCAQCREALHDERELEKLLHTQRVEPLSNDFTLAVLRCIAPTAMPIGASSLERPSRSKRTIRLIGAIPVALLAALFAIALFFPAFFRPASYGVATTGKLDGILHTFTHHISTLSETLGTSLLAIGVVVVVLLMAVDGVIGRGKAIR